MLQTSQQRNLLSPGASNNTPAASTSSSMTRGNEISLLADQTMDLLAPLAPPSYHAKAFESSPSNSTLSASARRSSTADSARMQKRQLQQELDRANAAAPRRDTAGLFKQACSTDLLFLMDTTNSMKPHMDAAKSQVKSIVADIKAAFFNESQVRIAIVGYTDHNIASHIKFLDFTTSTDRVYSFLDGLTTKWGDDFAEDVLGGIQQALSASWKQQTRCIVHIGDAPPHGSILHDLGKTSDKYHVVGSEPHGLTYEPLMRQMTRLNINYALLRITSYTDRMALCFGRTYGPGNARLLSVNKYYRDLRMDGSSIIEASKRSKGSREPAGEPQFEELQLGTTYSEIRRLVVSSVTSSVSRTIGNLTLALSKPSASGGLASPTDLTNIREEGNVDGSDDRAAPLEDGLPQWDTPDWLDETLEVQGFCPAIITHNADTLNDMMDADEAIKLSAAELTISARSKPFAQGALRVAFYARASASPSRFVLKRFIRGDQGRAEVVEDMRIQALCKAFALEFNGLVNEEPPLDFIVTSCLKSKHKTNSPIAGGSLSLEPFIDGDYVKYNSNGSYVNKDLDEDQFNKKAQAFSHFTFERSWGHYLISDLQGVGHLVTDPAIHTRDHDRFKLSRTNLHETGFKFFFTTHKCNTYCTQLGLKSNGDMFTSGDFAFRETWPALEPTICCSNMLCRGIIRLASAHQSDLYPGCYWCSACWSQLQESSDRWICIERGPTHKFDVNRFFHQSQGQLPPRRCPDHVEKLNAGTSAAAAGGRLWNGMKSSTATGMISGRTW